MRSHESNESSQNSDSSNSLAYSVRANSLNINDYILLRNGEYPCRITVKGGSIGRRVGRRKVWYTGIDIVTGRLMEEYFYADEKIKVPTTQYKEYHLVNMIGSTLALMTDSGELLEGIIIPETARYQLITKAIIDDFESGKHLFVTTVCAMGKEGFIGYREAALYLEAQSIPSYVQDDEMKG